MCVCVCVSGSIVAAVVSSVVGVGVSVAVVVSAVFDGVLAMAPNIYYVMHVGVCVRTYVCADVCARVNKFCNLVHIQSWQRIHMHARARAHTHTHSGSRVTRTR